MHLQKQPFLICTTLVVINSKMRLQLQNIVPIPLKDKFTKRPSDIWNREVTFSAGEWIKIVAPSGTAKLL